MTTNTDTHLDLDTPFGVDWPLPRVLIVDAPNIPAERLPNLEPYGDEEPWDEDRPFEWDDEWDDSFASVPVSVPAEDERDLPEPDIPPMLAEPERVLPAAPPHSEESAGGLFAGSYDEAVASLELHSYPEPIDQLKSIRNVAELWSLSPVEAHLLTFLLSRVNRDWLVRATTGWLSAMSRINKDSARVALDELERKGYVRRLRSPLPKQPLIVCLRPIAYREEGDRPERWRPPANPTRKRGHRDLERIRSVSAAIDAAEGRNASK